MTDRRLVSALLRTDFALFLRRAAMELKGDEPYQHNFHIDAICWQLRQVAQGDVKRLIVTMPPRHLKSLTVATAWVAWMLGKNPALRFICASYSYDLAEKHARDCMRLIDSPWYRTAFPAMRLVKRSMMDFETHLGGGRLSTSVGGVLTGRGADIIIVDDPLKADDALSETARNTVSGWFFNSLLSRLNRQEEGSIILVMQRLHEADLAGILLERGGWDELRLSAIATQDERVPIGPDRYYQRREGHALHAERLSLAKLKDIRAQDSVVFAAQYQQEPVPREGNFIERSWFTFYDEPPPSGIMVMSCDTASKEGLRNDYSVCIVARYYQGRHYIIDVYRERVGFTKLRSTVVDLCRRHKVDRLLIEDAASGIQLIQMLRHDAIAGVPLPLPCRPTNDKLTRFHAQASRVEAGEVVLPRNAPWLGDFIAEVIGFPNARHDDQADALAQMLLHSPRGGSPLPYGGDEILPGVWDEEGFDDDPFDDDDDACLY